MKKRSEVETDRQPSSDVSHLRARAQTQQNARDTLGDFEAR